MNSPGDKILRTVDSLMDELRINYFINAALYAYGENFLVSKSKDHEICTKSDKFLCRDLYVKRETFKKYFSSFVESYFLRSIGKLIHQLEKSLLKCRYVDTVNVSFNRDNIREIDKDRIIIISFRLNVEEYKIAPSPIYYPKNWKRELFGKNREKRKIPPSTTQTQPLFEGIAGAFFMI